MKRTLILLTMLQAGLLSAETTTEWAKNVSYFNSEAVNKSAYIPAKGSQPAAMWTYTEASTTGGGGHTTIIHQNRLIAYNAETGASMINKLTDNVNILKISYDQTSDEVVVLLSLQSPFSNPVIGTDTLFHFTDGNCRQPIIAHYNRSGELSNTQVLEIECGEIMTYLYQGDIHFNNRTVAVSAELFTPSGITTLNFGETERELHPDSAYTCVFEWDFESHPLKCLIVPQENTFNRSRIGYLAYNDVGDLYMLGDLIQDIVFASTELSKDDDKDASFIAKFELDGSVSHAHKVFYNDTPHYSRSLGLVYNPVSNTVNIACSWGGELYIDDLFIENGSSGGSSNIVLIQLDGELNKLNHTTVRYIDTVSELYTRIQSYNNLHVDDDGRLIVGFNFTDGFITGNVPFESPSEAPGNYHIGLIRFDNELNTDTFFVVSGTGVKHLYTFATGVENELYLGGRFSGQAIFPPLAPIFPETSFNDGYVAKINLEKGGQTSSVHDFQNDKFLFTIYPNPTEEQLYIEGENIAYANVYGVDGKVIRSYKLNVSYSMQYIDVHNLAPGLYVINIVTDEGLSSSAQFIKK